MSQGFSVMSKNRAIYIIDDDEAVRDSLKVFFEISGLEVETFSSGEEFLEVSDAVDSGCVILDIHLPGNNGFEILRDIKKKRNQLAVVMISGEADEIKKQRALQGGALDLLKKPISGRSLLKIFNSTIKEK